MPCKFTQDRACKLNWRRAGRRQALFTSERRGLETSTAHKELHSISSTIVDTVLQQFGRDYFQDPCTAAVCDDFSIGIDYPLATETAACCVPRKTELANPALVVEAGRQTIEEMRRTTPWRGLRTFWGGPRASGLPVHARSRCRYFAHVPAVAIEAIRTVRRRARSGPRPIRSARSGSNRS